ncbi:MAG: tRNA pseudouridine synthase A [Saprospiraceae bacterium]
MRYFFHISYKGSAYHGWQRQPKVNSVQQVVETVLKRALKKSIACIGCGRTDAQVHASQFFFHIDVQEQLNENSLYLFNKMLPNDIVIFDIIAVEGIPHAQFDASSRIYDYFIHTQKDPFLSDISSLYEVQQWDRESMQQALALLPHYQDYRGFCKTPDRHNHTICKMTSAILFFNTEGSKLQFQFTANGFLRGLIRLLVGSLIAVGTNKMTLAEFELVLEAKVAPKFPQVAYPQGLYLSKVLYPFLDLPTKGMHPFNLQTKDLF